MTHEVLENCRICGHPGPHGHYSAIEHSYGPRGEFGYFECSGCGCLQIDEIPEGIGLHYPDNYYSFQAPSRPMSFAKKWRRKMAYSAIPGLSAMARTLLKNDKHRSLARLKPSYSSAILDIGCGGGEFLSELAQIGFTNLTGIDPFMPEGPRKNDSIQLIKMELHEWTDDDCFDVVMMHHSLEHIDDQKMALECIARVLKPRGTCLIRIPVSSSYAWNHYKTNWIQLDAPRHFYLHSYSSISILAERVGMAVKEHYCDSTSFQFTGSERLRSGVTEGTDVELFGRAKLDDFRRQTRHLNKANQGDQAVFYLQRK